jgi:sterol desaturase/sphingolipid hydroxylase (fatty acid hydroxylase superfamily)
MYLDIHSVHHETRYEGLTFYDTNKGHCLEHVFQHLGNVLPFLFIELSILPAAVSFSIIGVRAVMRHDHRCTWLIGNHHLLHHKYSKYNFGEYWIDSICGTLYPDNDCYIYGLIYT